ncbi:MAG: aldo/keto reductase [Clostridia bacterium]|nr:aldo/keto reductase [Clostridia bacterium]
MIYKKFQGKDISALGMGTMRFPVMEGDNSQIDVAETARLVDYAMGQGVNYYDTAWGYHGGNSELVMGKILAKYPRESFHLADKFPGYDLANLDKVEEVFEKQLEKCGVDYFDFYLFHNVCEMNIDAYLNPKYGLMEYLRKQKASGRIRHLGFSIHGGMEVMHRFMDAYGEYMEFCQIQLNYIDWEFQDAKAKVELLRKWNIPIWVMEPVRGGKLAKLSAENERILKELRPEESIPAWAFRYLQSFPDVVVTLSGMSNEEQLKDNLKTYAEERPLNEKELACLLEIGGGILAHILPCTSCKYCLTHCPQELNIPKLLKLYNEHQFTGGGFIAPMALEAIPTEKHPDACIGCRSCETVCPQQIKIADAMADFTDRLRM